MCLAKNTHVLTDRLNHPHSADVCSTRTRKKTGKNRSQEDVTMMFSLIIKYVLSQEIQSTGITAAFVFFGS